MGSDPFYAITLLDAIARASPLPPTEVSPETAYILLPGISEGSVSSFPLSTGDIENTLQDWKRPICSCGHFVVKSDFLKDKNLDVYVLNVV